MLFRISATKLAKFQKERERHALWLKAKLLINHDRYMRDMAL